MQQIHKTQKCKLSTCKYEPHSASAIQNCVLPCAPPYQQGTPISEKKSWQQRWMSSWVVYRLPTSGSMETGVRTLCVQCHAGRSGHLLITWLDKPGCANELIGSNRRILRVSRVHQRRRPDTLGGSRCRPSCLPPSDGWKKSHDICSSAPDDASNGFSGCAKQSAQTGIYSHPLMGRRSTARRVRLTVVHNTDHITFASGGP